MEFKLSIFKVLMCFFSVFLFACEPLDFDDVEVVADQPINVNRLVETTSSGEIVTTASEAVTPISNEVISTISDDTETILDEAAILDEATISNEVVMTNPDGAITVLSEVDLLISWEDNSDNESEFIIERRIVSNVDYGVTYHVAENTTSFNDPQVQSGETYCYQITASNRIGGSPSTEVCIDI